MLGWITKKSEDAKIYMCIKDLKWTLQNSSPIERATVFAIAAVLGTEFFSVGMLPREVAHRPLMFSRELLARIYEALESIRNDTSIQLITLKKKLAQFGASFPPGVEAHAKRTCRAVEVWMVTVAAGIAPARADETRLIWKLLRESQSHLEEAFDDIVENEKLTMGLVGQDNGTFTSLDRQEWRETCGYVIPDLESDLPKLF